MALAWWLAVCGAAVALADSGLNTPHEVSRGREALRVWRRSQERAGYTGARIFGGFATHVGTYPFAVYYIIFEGIESFTCSGSIVSPQWVLTAAHCIQAPRWDVVVFAGDVDFTTDKVFTKPNIQMRMVKSKYEYTPPTPDHLDHDVMMMQLWRAFQMNRNFVSTIELTSDTSYPPDFMERCTVVGYGQRGRAEWPDTGVQRGASFMMEPGKKCGVPIVDMNGLCTLDVEKKSVCIGDSGGPILCYGKKEVFGVVMAIKYQNCCGEWCGAPALYNLHIFVGFYRDWILSFYQQPPGGVRVANGHCVVASLVALLCGLMLPLFGH